MITSLTRHLSIVEGPYNSRYPYCNCLYIDDEIKAIIDTGLGADDLNYLVSQHIDVVINSHFHEDHILNNRVFPSAQIWAHGKDAPAIRSKEVFLQYYGIRDKQEENLYRDFLSSRNILATPVHKEINDLEELDFGKVKLTAVFTPGHTPGHCCFFEEKEGTLFASDINLGSFGPWYAHACSDLDDFIASIMKCIALAPSMVVTSHSGIITEDITERFQSSLDIIFSKEDKVRRALAERPSTIEELEKKNIFYDATKKNYNPLVAVFDKLAVERHLYRLKKMGEIKQDGAIFYCT